MDQRDGISTPSKSPRLPHISMNSGNLKIEPAEIAPHTDSFYHISIIHLANNVLQGKLCPPSPNQLLQAPAYFVFSDPRQRAQVIAEALEETRIITVVYELVSESVHLEAERTKLDNSEFKGVVDRRHWEVWAELTEEVNVYLQRQARMEKGVYMWRGTKHGIWSRTGAPSPDGRRGDKNGCGYNQRLRDIRRRRNLLAKLKN